MGAPSSVADRPIQATLRVCHVIHSLQAGGAEESLAAIGSAAGKAGIEIEVLSLLPNAANDTVERLSSAGVHVATLGLRTRWDVRALGGALAFLRERSPDVVHTHLKHADIVGSFAASRLGIPQVSTLHVVEDRPRGVARAKRYAGARVRQRGAAITIAVSDAQRDWYLSALRGDPHRVVTVRNGVADPKPLTADLYGRLRETVGARPGELVATMAALMRPGKGHDDLLSLAEAVGPSAGVRFVLAGDGELRRELERRAIAASQRSAPVVFAGFRNDVPQLLAASDLVVHPSHADALPTALIHALAAGKPTLAYAVGGVPEIVTPDAGILASVGDRVELSEGLRQLLASETRERLAAGARARYEVEFTLDAWMYRLRRTYQSALSAAPSRRVDTSR
jgi:glycosyltransferase involved in cell wall biosynthesis